MSNVRRKTAEHLGHAWNVIPHVTQFDKADITPMEELRAKFRKQVEEAGGNLTVTAVLVKVLAAAVKQFPQFNASLDIDNNAIVYKKYINIGVAVDTEHGLIVPVLRDVDKKTMFDLSKELSELAEKAKQRKVTGDDLKGGTFTISNQGGIGGAYFTPIVNKPEVAILGIGRGVVKAIVKNKKIEPRTMLPLALSYDHRVIDGANAARFIVDLVQAIEQFKEGEVRI